MQFQKHEGSEESMRAAPDGKGKVIIPPRDILEEKIHSLDMHWYANRLQLLSLFDKVRVTGECTLSHIDMLLSMSLGSYVTSGTSSGQSEMDRVVFFTDCICNLVTGLSAAALLQVCSPNDTIFDEQTASKIIFDHFTSLRKNRPSQQ